MNNRYYGRDRYGIDDPADYTRDYGSGRDYTYSSARDYAAAGWRGEDRQGTRGGYRGERGGTDWDQGYDERLRDRSAYGAQGSRGRSGYGAQGFAGQDRHRGHHADHRGDRYGRHQEEDRGFFDRAGDEVRSWFGDEDAERRRRADQRYDERMGRNEAWTAGSDSGDPYFAWRRERIAELDRDYDEYRRENQTRFHNEFNSWRTERQGQRDCLHRVSEHMEVVGSDGAHVGTVDKVRGDRIVLTKNDAEAGGRHHSIPSRWIQSVDDKVTLRKTADEAHAHWKDEERSGALFGEDRERGSDDNDWSSGRNLNRSFSGTY